ncbi:MAG: MTAP family purine nucleoside phosphorylase, partial [Spirochaetales bacterium]|nr:MTAP family purine nucleoside phosphorylase [Spirochaetales bacterium]
MAVIGIIGGSGLEDLDLLTHPVEHNIDTPYGLPSAPPKSGEIKGAKVVLLSRHGPAHTIPPTQVNFRANIHALKTLGCTHILATTAVGSLREEIGRGDLAILDQFIDFTRHRKSTFHDAFEPHKMVHVSMADPFSAELR